MSVASSSLLVGVVCKVQLLDGGHGEHEIRVKSHEHPKGCHDNTLNATHEAQGIDDRPGLILSALLEIRELEIPQGQEAILLEVLSVTSIVISIRQDTGLEVVPLVVNYGQLKKRHLRCILVEFHFTIYYLLCRVQNIDESKVCLTLEQFGRLARLYHSLPTVESLYPAYF